MCHRLAAVAAALALSGSPARAGDTEQGFALAAFMMHLDALSTARVCAPGLPGFQARFDAAHARWRQRFATAVAGGEQLVVDGAKQDHPARAKLLQILALRDRLAQPAEPPASAASAPIPVARCEAVLKALSVD